MAFLLAFFLRLFSGISLYFDLKFASLPFSAERNLKRKWFFPHEHGAFSFYLFVFCCMIAGRESRIQLYRQYAAGLLPSKSDARNEIKSSTLLVKKWRCQEINRKHLHWNIHVQELFQPLSFSWGRTLETYKYRKPHSLQLHVFYLYTVWPARGQARLLLSIICHFFPWSSLVPGTLSGPEIIFSNPSVGPT